MPSLSRSPFWAAAFALALLPAPGPGDEPAKKPPTVMQRKLSNAQLVLEGLAMANFEKIEKGADGLLLCVRDASWRAIKSPKYDAFSNEFQRNLESLKKASNKKNVDAASLAYVEMTLTCVKCHQLLRDERMGRAPAVDVPRLAGR
jgi:hypothetical protein